MALGTRTRALGDTTARRTLRPHFWSQCGTIANVELIAKERDRLLLRSARAIGLASTILALLCLSVPGVVIGLTLASILPLFAVLLFCLVRVGFSHSIVWVVLGILAGLAILVVLQQPISGPPTVGMRSALVPLAGGAIASFAIVLTSTAARFAVLIVSLVASTVLAELAIGERQFITTEGASIVLGWIILTVLGYWLSASIPRAARRIYSIGRAHRAERQASETEAQRDDDGQRNEDVDERVQDLVPALGRAKYLQIVRSTDEVADVEIPGRMQAEIDGVGDRKDRDDPDDDQRGDEQAPRETSR